MAYTDTSIMPYTVADMGPGEANMLDGDDSTLYAKGSLLEETIAGTVIPAVADHATNGIHYIFAEATLTAATAAKVKVEEILTTTRWWAQVHHDAAASAVVAQANIGDVHAIVISSQIWAIDIETALSNGGDVVITNIWDNVYDYDTSGDESGQFGLAQCRIRNARLVLNPT